MRNVPAAILGLGLACFAAGAAADELPNDFLRQYEPAVARLREAYGHATIRGQFRLEFPSGGGLARTLDFVLQIDGERALLDETNYVGYENDGTPIENQARYDLSPTEGWALREHVQTDQRGGEQRSYTVRLDYGGLRDGLPLVKRIEIAFGSGPGLKTDQLRVIEISEITFGTSIDPKP